MKLPALLSALALTFAIAACGNSHDKPPASDKPAEPATKPVEPAPNPTTEPAKPTDPNAKPAEPTAAGDIPTECTEYKAAIEKLATCDKLPADAKTAMQSSLEQMSKSWTSLTADTKAAAGTACKAALDAAKQASSACGQ